MNVSDVKDSQLVCEVCRPGLEINNAVRDACQSVGVVVFIPHNDSVASPVSSITPTLTRSAVVPSFLETTCHRQLRNCPESP
jgi:hypothetical protein